MPYNSSKKNLSGLFSSFHPVHRETNHCPFVCYGYLPQSRIRSAVHSVSFWIIKTAKSKKVTLWRTLSLILLIIHISKLKSEFISKSDLKSVRLTLFAVHRTGWIWLWSKSPKGALKENSEKDQR